MQQDTLSEILEVEKEIKAMLDAERKRADQLLPPAQIDGMPLPRPMFEIFVFSPAKPGGA